MKRRLWWLAVALPLAAQPKLLINAKLETHSAGSGLESTFNGLLKAQPQPMWIAYSVPSMRNNYGMGCEYVRDGLNTAGVVHLEPPDHAVILYRVEGGAVNRIRTLSPDCEIDAGGVPVHWLNDVQPAQSVALLVSFVKDRERIGDSPVSAIAQHADPAADAALDRFLAPDQPDSLRLRAVSAFGSVRGSRGFEVIRKVIAGDRDERVRERAVQSLGSSREPGATDLLISIARSDQNVRLREQAISAISRKPAATVLPVLEKIIDSDPSPQVQQRAVSALRELPDGTGVPVLIRLVKAQNVEVRKRAMQTLQQSRDPRAVAFFEDVLKH